MKFSVRRDFLAVETLDRFELFGNPRPLGKLHAFQSGDAALTRALA